MQDLLITAGITQLLAESGTNQQSMETMPFSLSPEEITAALAEHEALESKIDLYPNPTTDLVHITGASQEEVFYQIFDDKGLLLTHKVSAEKNSFSLAAYSKGTYYIRIYAGNSYVVRKVVKL